MSFPLRMLLGFCVKDWWRVSVDIMNVWSHRESEWANGCSGSENKSLKVSLPWNSKESRTSMEEHRTWGWRLNTVWVQALNGRRGQCRWSPSSSIPGQPGQRALEWIYLFCPCHIQSARFCNLCLPILARGNGWCQRRQRSAVDWRGIFQTQALWQSVLIKSHCHLLSPSGSLSLSCPTWRADIKG